MSKCDFEVEFDRDNRTYLAGEQVSGTVRLRVNKTVQCRKVSIKGLWKTHGRGNHASDEYFEQTVFEGELIEGQTYEFKFEFAAGLHPWTYRGHHLNIDHYIHVRIDVPWALDPKYETEFIVTPSPQSPLDTIATDSPTTTDQVAGHIIMLVVGTIFFVVGIPLTLFLGFGLIFMGVGAILIYMVIRNTLAERKLGKVELSIEPPHAAPGEWIQVQIRFVPRSAGTLNNLTLKLEGEEEVVSGSGTNKTTHTHKLHEENIIALENFEFQAGSPVSITERIQLPESNAYSVNLRDNSIQWQVQAQLDIPRWPDWVDVRSIILLPSINDPKKSPGSSSPPSENQVDTAHATPGASQELPPPFSDNSHDAFSAETDSFATSKAPAEAWNNSAKPSSSPSTNAAITSPELLELIAMLAESNRFGDERQDLIDQHSDRTLTAVLRIDRTSYTYGVFDAPEYRNGQTISGTLEGSDQRISIQLPEANNDFVGDLNVGDLLSVCGRVMKWDDLYNRIELRGTLYP
jgi:hypothetical protein